MAPTDDFASLGVEISELRDGQTSIVWGSYKEALGPWVIKSVLRRGGSTLGLKNPTHSLKARLPETAKPIPKSDFPNAFGTFEFQGPKSLKPGRPYPLHGPVLMLASVEGIVAKHSWYSSWHRTSTQIFHDPLLQN